MDDLTDLIAFLSHSNPAVKQHAVELVQGLTGSPEGISQLAGRAESLLPPLFRLASEPTAISRPALSSIVNLAPEPSIHAQLLKLNAPARCMDYLMERTCPGNESLLVMLLANLTADEVGAAAVLQLGKEGMEGLNLAILLKLFLDEKKSDGEDPYEHVATILPNLARFKAGRQVLLEPGRGTLRALSTQLRACSELRRRGSAGAIKNCCFSCEEDGTAEAIARETEALTEILGVLAGIPKPEADDMVRENLAEAVLCLTKVDSARKLLWKVDAPGLLRKAYEHEEHPGVCEAMEGAAEFFLQDGFKPEVEEIVEDAAGGQNHAGEGRPDAEIKELE